MIQYILILLCYQYYYYLTMVLPTMKCGGLPRAHDWPTGMPGPPEPKGLWQLRRTGSFCKDHRNR